MAREAPHNKIRVAGRLTNALALDLVKLTGFGRDVIDGLLIGAIVQANVDQITRDPALQRAYATLDQPPPDHLRRPISISAVANSLHIPFETARRRILAMADLGTLLVTPAGVIAPQAPLNSPFYRMGAQVNYELVRTLYHRLRDIDLLADLPHPTLPPFEPDNPPVRLLIRLSSSFLLRLAESLGTVRGDMVSVLIVMDVIHANTEHLNDLAGGADDADWTPAGFVDDRHRKAVRASELSRRLGIPAETVRRRLAQLVAEDICERTKAGFVVPARVLAQPPFTNLMMDNQSHLYRLFAGLAEFGILAEWEGEVLRRRGAA